jgi:hypothetical protein
MSITVSNRNEAHRKYFPRLGGYCDAISNQAGQVLHLMMRDGHVSRLTAMHYGVPNLTARVSELRKAGYPIDCEVKLDASGREYGRWFLMGSAAPTAAV